MTDTLEEIAAPKLNWLIGQNNQEVLGALRSKAKEKNWRIGIFGGAVRDCIALGAMAKPRDLDIVVSGPSSQEFEDLFTGIAIKNRFGGYRVNSDLPLDIWPLHRTHRFQVDKKAAPTFHDLAGTPFLNIEALVVELDVSTLTWKTLHERGAVKAFRTKTIEMLQMHHPRLEVCVLKSLATAYRYGFSLGPNISHLLAMYAVTPHIGRVLAVHRSVKGSLPFRSSDTKEWLLQIKEQYDRGERFMSLPPRQGQLEFCFGIGEPDFLGVQSEVSLFNQVLGW